MLDWFSQLWDQEFLWKTVRKATVEMEARRMRSTSEEETRSLGVLDVRCAAKTRVLSENVCDIGAVGNKPEYAAVSLPDSLL